MDVFNFCWSTLLTESKKHSVFLEKDTCKVENEYDEEFDKPIKRISFWYKYASFNIYFFNRCLSNFIESAPDSIKIIDKICTIKNLNICSLSTGPGSYVIGFLYSLHLLGKSLCKNADFRFISKHGHWRSFVSQMLNAGTVNVPESSSCQLIGCDILTELSTKAQSYIKIADVLFMCNTFSSPRANKDVTHSVLKDILQLLKPGTLVFFVASEETSSCFQEFNIFGHFLYGPTNTTVENIPYDQKVTDWIGVTPMDSGSSFFAVWQKFDSILEEKPSPVKLIKMTPSNVLNEKSLDDKNVRTNNGSSLANISTSKQDAFNLKSASDLYSTALKSYANTPMSTQRDVSSVSECIENTVVQTTGSNRHSLLNSKNEHCVQSVQTDVPITNQKMESPHKHITEASLNSLIKSVERLVTNLDDFVRSKNKFSNSCEQKEACAGHLPNNHHAEKVCQHSMFNGCACNQFHSSCNQSCNRSSGDQTNTACAGHLPCIYPNEKVCKHNSFSGCACQRFNPSCNHSCMSSYNSHYCNSFISMNHQHQNTASKVSHLVLPLHNVTEQTLAQVLSLVSSNNSSSQ